MAYHGWQKEKIITKNKDSDIPTEKHGVPTSYDNEKLITILDLANLTHTDDMWECLIPLGLVHVK